MSSNWKDEVARAEEEYKTIFNGTNTTTSIDISIDNNDTDDGKGNLLVSELGYLTTQDDNKKKNSIYRYPPQAIPNLPPQLSADMFLIPERSKNTRYITCTSSSSSSSSSS